MKNIWRSTIICYSVYFRNESRLQLTVTGERTQVGELHSMHVKFSLLTPSIDEESLGARSNKLVGVISIFNDGAVCRGHGDPCRHDLQGVVCEENKRLKICICK